MSTSTRTVRLAIPSALLAAATRRRATTGQRAAASGLLLGYWSAVYAAYRRESLARTARERELLATANLEAFSRHYNERVPTIEEEFDIWGEYHQHRHEMRYDLLAEQVRAHVPPGGRILDVGCGSVLVADRILDVDAHYVGIDFGGHHIAYAAKKLADTPARLRSSLARGDGEALPFTDDAFDVVVFSEVIEHLMRPERAVWEIARVLKPGGVLLMTTNNASEAPLRSPLSHLFAWIEKAVGADHPSLISMRPWIWAEPVDPTLLPPDAGPVYLPHTHHIQGETRRLFAAAGLETFAWSSFEFPPPQSATARWLDTKGEWGRRTVDVIEAAARRTPVLRRLGCHLLMQARKTAAPVAAAPPAGVWPGPFSEAA
ncbi:MAG: Methyltransferase type 11 [Acidimicrobiales bacterium]|nr:Methyltransferase type 11 [Acidimicrobiales bacterium]